MEVKCTREECGKIWNYKGGNKFYGTCPDCKKNIKLKEWDNLQSKGSIKFIMENS